MTNTTRHHAAPAFTASVYRVCEICDARYSPYQRHRRDVCAARTKRALVEAREQVQILHDQNARLTAANAELRARLGVYGALSGEEYHPAPTDAPTCGAPCECCGLVMAVA